MDRRDFLRLGGAGLAGTLLLGTAGASGVRAEAGPLKARFGSAAARYKVPEELLLAIGYVNTLWEMPPPTASPYERGDLHGRGAYGVMQLEKNPTRDTLGRAASLTGLSEEELKGDRGANVTGGAAVLADIQGADRPRDLNGWYEAVAEYGGSPLYANEVYGVMNDGVRATISTGESIELLPQEGAGQRLLLSSRARGDYGGSTWYGASSRNYSNASRPPTINKIIIHVAQGSYAGTLNWFKNPAAKASAHYTVSKYGAVGQSVREQDIAWHAGWWNYNKTSIGIEHAGYIGDRSWFTKAMYRSSARLTAYLCRKYRIPVDRRHIIGHNQVPGCSGAGGGKSCHMDPGRYWNWTAYMRRVRSYR
jgi:hypothetical protein